MGALYKTICSVRKIISIELITRVALWVTWAVNPDKAEYSSEEEWAYEESLSLQPVTDSPVEEITSILSINNQQLDSSIHQAFG